MSIRLMNAAWDTPTKLDPTARLILLSLADQANDEGWCWPAVASTARRCGVSDDSARRWIHTLEARGHLERHDRPGRSTMYRVLTPRADATPGGDATPRADATPTPRADAGPPLAPTRAEPKENRKSEPKTRRERRGEVAETLDGMPDPAPSRTAGDLVTAWIDGYHAAHGTAPLGSQIQRMSATARRLASDLDSLDDPTAWPAGLELARRAGADGFMDLVLAIPKYHGARAGQRTTGWWVAAGAIDSSLAVQS